MPRIRDNAVRNKALCYLRLSVTKNQSDLVSIERQRANIINLCDKLCLVPEWYEDAKGHRSGRNERNRPGWQALLRRVNDPDIAAVVFNELSRANRNALNSLQFLENLPTGVKTYTALYGHAVDISTAAGRMNVFHEITFDDIRALEDSNRAKDSVRYRKEQGITIGIPPFGTVRDRKTGYLIPSSDGAWLLPDGKFIAGDNPEDKPDPQAIWRGYAECARTILELYAENRMGYKRLAEKISDGGWTIKSQDGTPRRPREGNVRVIVSSWPSYAGIRTEGRAKELPPEMLDDLLRQLESADPQRAVFDLDLLRAVARTQKIRRDQYKKQRRPNGTSAKAHPFALSNILYCAECDRIAKKTGNSSRRARINGWNKQGSLNYRHTRSRPCTCKRKSLPASDIESDFADLLQKTISLNPSLIATMSSQARDCPATNSVAQNADDEYAKWQRAIAKHKQALANLKTSFHEGEIDEEEYFTKRDKHESALAQLQEKPVSIRKVQLSMKSIVESLANIPWLWQAASPENRKALTNALFDEAVYDLDQPQFTNHKLKTWVEQFLTLPTEFEVDEEQDNDSRNSPQGVR